MEKDVNKLRSNSRWWIFWKSYSFFCGVVLILICVNKTKLVPFFVVSSLFKLFHKPSNSTKGKENIIKKRSFPWKNKFVSFLKISTEKRNFIEKKTNFNDVHLKVF